MLIYDNEYQTKENKNWTKNKIEQQHIRGEEKILWEVAVYSMITGQYNWYETKDQINRKQR